MKRCDFTTASQKDLIEIHDYIAEDRPVAAARLLQRLERACKTLASTPHKGRPREDLAPAMRVYLVKPYLIFFRLTREGILVMRVIHGARDLPEQFPSN
jgi:toxin ParE1/3/4